ncbi:MAG TPA: ROK family protein [Candidatus Limnocylindria bacterium]|nr:ROK family protein [Candidatus Limnocylindria bacterium]
MDEAAGQPILAIDLGGTQIRAACVSPDLHLASRRATDTNDQEGVDAVVDRLCALAAEVLADASDAGLPDPAGIGISSPGPLDPWRGVVLAPPNLAGWRDVPLVERAESALGLPAFLERDTNVAVMAEWRHGAAREARDVIYITVSTGIGGGIVVDGRPLIGPDGTAGEVGHVTVELDGPLCGDGSPGHAEAIGSGTAIARQGRALLETERSPHLAAVFAASGAGELGAEPVARAADEGDAACRAVLDRAWVAIGALCASLVNVLNPEVIVIGGSIAAHRPELFDVVRLEIERRAFAAPARRVRVVPAEHGDDVSLIGLLPIVNERLQDPAYRRGRSPVANV